MSPPSSSSQPGGPYRKPKADVYTLLLAVALLAIILGIVCFYLEMDQYEFKFKGSPVGAVEPAYRVAMVDVAAPRCSVVGATFFT